MTTLKMEISERRKRTRVLRSLRRHLCSQLRRSIAQLKKTSSPQFPKLRPTPETAAPAEQDHVQGAIGRDNGSLA